ncbi:Major viral transcription factor ICP4, partial [Clarias magur]
RRCFIEHRTELQSRTCTQHRRKRCSPRHQEEGFAKKKHQGLHSAGVAQHRGVLGTEGCDWLPSSVIECKAVFKTPALTEDMNKTLRTPFISICC